MSEDEYFPGIDCRCCATNESECACNVDWTDPRIYELEKQFEEYKKENQHLKNEIQKLTNQLASSEIKYGINS